MRFQVPQFIETETKIVGPLTLKQFLWLGFGGAILTFLYITLPHIAFFVLAIPITGLFVALAYVKIDNIQLFNYIIYALSYSLNPRRYLFKKEEGGDLIDTSENTEIIEEHKVN